MNAAPQFGAFIALTHAVGDALEADHIATGQLLAAVIESLRVGPPAAPLNGVQAEFTDWAAFATPAEREAMLIACLGEMVKAPAHKAQIKRALAAMFKRLNAKDRAAFLEWAARQDDG